jgi:CRISPR/Cas system-associated exonuclease Cas4 (RecB family)
MDPDAAWTSPSDLADYAYCPRSHWYRHHPPTRGPSKDSQRRSAAGERYHARTLGAERHRAERGSAYWLGVILGILLVAAGVAWFLHSF